MLVPIISPSIFNTALETQALDLEASSTQCLNISSANFGAYSSSAFSISCWVKRESLGNQYIAMGGITTGTMVFELGFDSSDHLFFNSYRFSGASDAEYVTTDSYTSTSDWYHILVHFDGSDEVRLWINGSRITSFSTSTPPFATLNNSDRRITIGALQSFSFLAPFDGLIYQMAFFSGSFPSISSLYDSGHPKDIRGVSGLYSLLDVAGGDVTSDYVLSANWTNNNTVTASSTIPA